MKKVLSIFVLSLFAVAMFADSAVIWSESFNKNGNEVKKKGTYWPYANEWFTGYNVSDTETITGSQYVEDYDAVESKNVSIRSKKLNGAETGVPGLFFPANKEAADNYVTFKVSKENGGFYGKLDRNGTYKLYLEVCNSEGSYGDLDSLEIYVNGLGLVKEEGIKLGEKLKTTQVEIELPNEILLTELQFRVRKVENGKQIFISKFWITYEAGEAVEPEPLADGYYLVGSHNEWTPEASEMFSVNEQAGQGVEEYMLTTTIQEGNQVKVAQVSKEQIVKWFPESDESGDHNFEIGGELGGQILTIYFRPAGNPQWTDFGGFCYVEVMKNPIPGEDEPRVFLMGDFNGWDAMADYQMEREPTAGWFVIEMEMAKGTEFKVLSIVNSTEIWYPSSDDSGNNNIVITKELAGYLRITFDIEAPHADWNFGQVNIEVLEPAEEEEEVVVADGFYLVGDFTDWQPQAEYMFIANPNKKGEYMVSLTLTEGQKLKGILVRGGQWTWFPDGDGNDIVVDAEHAGKVTIYFCPDGNKDWPLQYIFIEKDGAPAPQYLTCADLLKLAALFDDPTSSQPSIASAYIKLRAFVIEAGQAMDPQNMIRRVMKTQEVWLADDAAAAAGTIKAVMASVEGDGVVKGDWVELVGLMYKNFKDGKIVLEVQDGVVKKQSDIPSGIEAVADQKELFKAIQNGQIIIIYNGVKYNVKGAVIE